MNYERAAVDDFIEWLTDNGVHLAKVLKSGYVTCLTGDETDDLVDAYEEANR